MLIAPPGRLGNESVEVLVDDTDVGRRGNVALWVIRISVWVFRVDIQRAAIKQMLLNTVGKQQSK